MNKEKILTIFNRYITAVDFNELLKKTDSIFFSEIDKLYIEILNNKDNNIIDENIIDLAFKINDILFKYNIHIK